jgi:hypothetical protein
VPPITYFASIHCSDPARTFAAVSNEELVISKLADEAKREIKNRAKRVRDFIVLLVLFIKRKLFI